MINWDALDGIQRRQERAFLKIKDLNLWNYVGGETWPSRQPQMNIDIMVIGERPGAQEDVAKRPFVGDAGIALRSLMQTALDQQFVWITNTVKFYASRNRTPTLEEIGLAAPYLAQEWHAVGRPRITICLGNVPLTAVTNRAKVSTRAGQCEVYTASDGQECYVWPMLHPSFGVRTPSMRRVIESHWEALGGWLDVRYKG
jgi:uracil-DNA glycosylase family 4